LPSSTPRYPTGERNRTMLRLMLNTGLRLAEVTALKWHDLNLTTGKLMVHQGKGSKDRALWVAEGYIDRLRSWRERQATQCGQCEHVFTTLDGKPLGHQYVQRMVKRYATKAGIDKNILPIPYATPLPPISTVRRVRSAWYRRCLVIQTSPPR